MKNLEKIQKAVKVLKILATIAAVFTIVDAAFLLVGGIVLTIPALEGLKPYLFDSIPLTTNLKIESLRNLLFALCLAMDAALLLYARHCFQAELSEGTPFTQKNAVRVRNLGLWSIVVSLVSQIVTSLLCVSEILEDEIDFDNAGGLAIGIALILFSLILRYGAELEERTKESVTHAE